MTQLARVVLLALIAVIVLSTACSGQPAASPTAEPLPWGVFAGQYSTRDVVRAQQEVPFRIVLPTFIPRSNAPPLPGITGPLRAYQEAGRAYVEIIYLVDVGGSTSGVVWIQEYNYPVRPADPKQDSRYQYVDVGGRTLIKTEGNLQLGPGVIFYFNHDNVYYEVEVSNFSYEEAVKVVESMVKQLQ